MGLYMTIARQFREPRGLGGRLAARLMERGNAGLHYWVIELLQIRPGDRVLEIGFGPGLGLERAALKATQGSIVGVDFSLSMVRRAAHRNAAAIAAGTMRLVHQDFAQFGAPDATFDKVYAVNVLYFWQNPLGVLRRVHGLLAVGGTVALGFAEPAQLAKLPFTKGTVFTTYTGDAVLQLLMDAGFRDARLERVKKGDKEAACALAQR